MPFGSVEQRRQKHKSTQSVQYSSASSGCLGINPLFCNGSQPIAVSAFLFDVVLLFFKAGGISNDLALENIKCETYPARAYTETNVDEQTALEQKAHRNRQDRVKSVCGVVRMTVTREMAIFRKICT